MYLWGDDRENGQKICDTATAFARMPTEPNLGVNGKTIVGFRARQTRHSQGCTALDLVEESPEKQVYLSSKLEMSSKTSE